MKKFIKEIYPYIVIIVVVMLFRYFIATPVRVDGNSMYSTLYHGDILILNKLDRSYKRFDIVVINYGDEKVIKRVIGLPGENVEFIDNELYINGEKIKDIETSRTVDFSLKKVYGIEKLPDNYYFVVGDNRVGNNSADSRDPVNGLGLINKEDIVGTTSIRVFPFNRISKFN